MSINMRLIKLRLLYNKMISNHSLGMDYAKELLSEYPELVPIMADIRNGILPENIPESYQNYTDKIISKYPELKKGLTKFLEIINK